MCDDITSLPLDQTEALAEAVLQSCLGLILMLHTCTAGSGPSLTEALLKAATSVATPTKQLLQDIFQKASGSTIKSSVGQYMVPCIHGSGHTRLSILVRICMFMFMFMHVI